MSINVLGNIYQLSNIRLCKKFDLYLRIYNRLPSKRVVETLMAGWTNKLINWLESSLIYHDTIKMNIIYDIAQLIDT